MNIKEEILDLLNNVEKIETDEKDLKAESQITELIVQTYSRIVPSQRVEFTTEACAYAIAKAIERTVLSKIRPGQISVWLVLMEIHDGAKFNLPAHIEDKIYDYMDACENAVEEYISNNLGFDIINLVSNIQKIGVMLEERHKLSSIEVAGLTNDKIMTRDELHNFCLQGAIKSLEEKEYKIENVNLGSANPISIVASKDGIKYNICVLSDLLPKTGELSGWKLREFEKIVTSDSVKKAILGVSIIPTNELYASMGVAVKEGDYSFKISPVNVIDDKNSNLEK